MGLLTEGSPLSWEDTKKYADHVRKHGIQQFLNLYHKRQGRTKDVLYWGDEVSATSVLLSPSGPEHVNRTEQEWEKPLLKTWYWRFCNSFTVWDSVNFGFRNLAWFIFAVSETVIALMISILIHNSRHSALVSLDDISANKGQEVEQKAKLKSNP